MISPCDISKMTLNLTSRSFLIFHFYNVKVSMMVMVDTSRSRDVTRFDTFPIYGDMKLLWLAFFVDRVIKLCIWIFDVKNISPLLQQFFLLLLLLWQRII
ncbi:hypothetical protein ACF0H5_007497 [Mactra antiquata]